MDSDCDSARDARLLVTVSAIGTVEPDETADVNSKLNGIVKTLGADPRGTADRLYAGKSIDYGTPVEVGSVLAVIDDAPYAAQVTQARASCRRGQAAIAEAKAKAKLAELEFERARELVKNKAVSAADFEVLKQKNA